MKTNSVRKRFGIGLGLLLSALSVASASDEPELTMAVRNRDVAQVERLLSQGVDIEERDEGIQQTALMRAAQVSDVRMVQILLAHRASVDAQDDEGNTALFYAVQRGNMQIVRVLVNSGADPRLRNTQGVSASTLARKRGSYSLIATLKKQQHHQGNVARR